MVSLRIRTALIWGAVTLTVSTLITLYWVLGGDPGCFWFLLLFSWRYTRLVVCVVGFMLYRPVPKPAVPSYHPNTDVTVVLPTIDPLGPDFVECLAMCAANRPARVIIVTAGDRLLRITQDVVRPLADAYQPTEFTVQASDVVGKRHQVATAIPLIRTPLTVLMDDHVFWPHVFLSALLWAFEDPAVGLVATNKRVRRRGGPLWNRCWNMLGALYLERHNFEIRATSAIDGGVFVVSGRTAAARTEILQHRDFLPAYRDERFLFGALGPLKADDDNYLTRFAVRAGWAVRVHASEATRIETTIGVASPVARKFLGQCARWSRTTWRSNPCSLFTDGTVWARQPFCVYAVYLASLTNFALLVDPLLLHLATRTVWYERSSSSSSSSSSSRSPYLLPLALAGWILLTKVVKVYPYYRRHPQDMVLFPVYLLFGYFHSLIKLYALVTFYDCSWSGRDLKEV